MKNIILGIYFSINSFVSVEGGNILRKLCIWGGGGEAMAKSKGVHTPQEIWFVAWFWFEAHT